MEKSAHSLSIEYSIFCVSTEIYNYWTDSMAGTIFYICNSELEEFALFDLDSLSWYDKEVSINCLLLMAEMCED